MGVFVYKNHLSVSLLYLFLFWQILKKLTSNARWGTGVKRQLGCYSQQLPINKGNF